MTTIELYQPGLPATQVPLPTEWNELSLQELHIISRHMLTPYEQQGAGRIGIFADLVEFRAKRNKVKLPPNWFSLLDADAAVPQILTLLDFIYTDNTRTDQPYSTLKVPGLIGARMVGPASNFDGITVGEFEDAEVFFHQFRANPEAESLATLAAVLYRPKGQPYMWLNGHTGKYETYKALKVQPRFLKLQPWELYTIFIWFTGCRATLPRMFPHVFGTGGGSSEPDEMAFTKSIHAAAGPKNGTRDQVRCTLLKEFFFELELEAIKAKELKDEYERNKRR